MNESILDICLKLSLAFLFSGLIGFEREINQSSAGLKTHILVGISTALIGILQLEAVEYAISLDSTIVNVDPVRLVAQVVSGIGFLGAGAIIVTKRTIQGLTTAASIWAVSAIGIAIGVGSYWTATLGFLFVIASLIIFKRLIVIDSPRSVVIKYLHEPSAHQQVQKILNSQNVPYETTRLSMEILGDQLIMSQVFRLKKPRSFDFEKLVTQLAETDFIVSVELSDID